MLTVKQVLESYNVISDTSGDIDIKLSALVSTGLIEESKLPMIRRSLNKSVNEMTEAERKTLKGLLESLMDAVLLDESRKMDYPSDKEMPVVIILKRKAIRVYPDNQKVGLYYSQALDRYISIPFGKNAKDLSPVLNENRPLVSTSKPKRSAPTPQTTSPILSHIQATREKSASTPRVRTRNPESNPDVIRALAQREPGLTKKVKEKQDRENYGRAKDKLVRSLGSRDLNDAGVGMGTAAMAHLRKDFNVTNAVGVVAGMAVNKGVNAVKKGFASVKNRFKQKAQQIKEEQDQDIAEVAPVLGAVAGAARAGLWAVRTIRGAKAAKSAAEVAKGVGKKARAKPAPKPKPDKAKPVKPKRDYTSRRKLPSLNNKEKDSNTTPSDSEPLFKKLDGDYSFSAQPKVSAPDRSEYTNALVANIAWTGKTRGSPQTTSGAMSYVPRQQQFNESTITQLRNMVENNVDSHAICLGEETISINKSIAKKIVRLHESLSSENKKKLENMLQENALTFRKALNFALKQ
jgi:hypothetical protein